MASGDLGVGSGECGVGSGEWVWEVRVEVGSVSGE